MAWELPTNSYGWKIKEEEEYKFSYCKQKGVCICVCSSSYLLKVLQDESEQFVEAFRLLVRRFDLNAFYVDFFQSRSDAIDPIFKNFLKKFVWACNSWQLVAEPSTLQKFLMENCIEYTKVGYVHT